MTWLGVGNVEGRVLSGDPSTRRPKGSLALAAASRATSCLAWAGDARVRPGDVLVFATDGVDAAFADSLDTLRLDAGDQRAHPAEHGRPSDDALVVAVRYLGGGRERARGRFAVAYTLRLASTCASPSESSLPCAYELAREAVRGSSACSTSLSRTRRRCRVR
jgi:hypothetical protein